MAAEMRHDKSLNPFEWMKNVWKVPVETEN